MADHAVVASSNGARISCARTACTRCSRHRAVLGFFGSAWFGWAQDSPPQAWRSALVAGSILSLLVCAAGTLLTWRRWSEPTALDAQTSRVFGIVVGIEFALAGLGAGGFAAVGRADVIAAWVAVVVGVHLFPLAVLFKYRLLRASSWTRPSRHGP